MQAATGRSGTGASDTAQCPIFSSARAGRIGRILSCKLAADNAYVDGTMPRRTAARFLHAPAIVLLLAPAASPASAQTIRGRLLDVENDVPVNLGLIIMFTEAGDSVAYTVTDEGGYFSVTSPDPGSYLLLASALGYRETPAGIFDLAEDGEMTVEFRIRPQPLLLDQILVALDRPVFDHQLVRNGFVTRYQRGLGHFITPHDIEESPARATEQLLAGIPDVVVRVADGPLSYLGDMVVMRNISGGDAKVWCTPMVFVDGRRVTYDHLSGISLTMLVPLETVEAVEVYRRPAEIPAQYDVTRRRSEDHCGVILVWTKLR